MPIIGILDNQSDNVLYFSSTDIAHYMELIKHAISFATNIRDGRLEEISHTPYMQHGSPLDTRETHVMLVTTRSFMSKNNEIVLHFCMDYLTSELDKDIARQLLDVFIEGFQERVKIKGKFLEKLKDSNDEFLSTCDELYHDTMVRLDLMTSQEVDFLLDVQDQERCVMNLLFSSISVQGLPVVAKFYDNMVAHFRVNVSGSEDPNFVLENLISAQLSTLFYQSLLQGTSCNYIVLRFTDFISFTERILTVNFFPISNDDGQRVMKQDDFAFIIMSEGDPEMVTMFQSSVTPMLAATGLLSEKFNGNVTKYASLASLLEKFPRSLQLD